VDLASGSQDPEDLEGTGLARGRFMALTGLLVSALFFLLILAQTIPIFFIDPCLR